MTERRCAARVQPQEFRVCRLLAMGGTVARPAIVYDLSRSGAALILPQPPRKAALWGIALLGESEAVLAQQVHGTMLPDGGWRGGFKFVLPLEQQQVDAVLRGSYRAGDDPVSGGVSTKRLKAHALVSPGFQPASTTPRNQKANTQVCRTAASAAGP